MLNFLKKYFHILFIIIFIITFSYFIKDDYIQKYRQNNLQKINNKKIISEINEFSTNDIQELSKIDLYYTPYRRLLDIIVEKINNSKKEVYIEVYMLTENRIKDSLSKAKKRGVDVKIILEKNPYKANNINNKHFKFLKDRGINIKWSNPDNYTLNHTKLLIIDEQFIISSGNLTYSTFNFNRDFFIFGEDENILSKLKQIFINDFNGNTNIIYHSNLVLSPNYSRTKFEKIINSAKKEINMYFQYVEDQKLEQILIKQANNGVKIKLIVSKKFYEDKDKINYLRKNNIAVKVLKKEKMHGKAILVDDKILFIGSINFSSYSIDKNREIGILIKNQDIVNKFSGLFNKDFEIN